MARPKQIPPQEPLKVYSVKLTSVLEEILQGLSRDVSDLTGWTVSSSAVIRALVRHAGQQRPAWVVDELYPLIVAEIAQGRVWGSKKRGGP